MSPSWTLVLLDRLWSMITLDQASENSLPMIQQLEEMVSIILSNSQGPTPTISSLKPRLVCWSHHRSGISHYHNQWHCCELHFSPMMKVLQVVLKKDNTTAVKYCLLFIWIVSECGFDIIQASGERDICSTHKHHHWRHSLKTNICGTRTQRAWGLIWNEITACLKKT